MFEIELYLQLIYLPNLIIDIGYELFEELSKKYNFKILIIDSSESNKSREKEFADDLISIIHYFSMKLYGSRSYKQKVKKAEDNLNQIKQEIE